MQCKKCGKECMESELTNGYCSDCIEKYRENSEEIHNIGNHLANTYRILMGIVILIGIIFTILVISISGSILSGILVIIATALMTLFFRTISEILQLLEDIKNK